MAKKITKKEEKPKVEEVQTPEVTAEVTPPTKEEFIAGVVVSANDGLKNSDVTAERLLGGTSGKFIAKKDGSAWVVLFPNGEVHRVYTGKDAEENAKGFAEKQSNKTFR